MRDNVIGSKFSKGSALVIVLAAVAILIILYFLNVSSIFGPAIKIKGAPPGVKPWDDESRILPLTDPVPMSEAPKFVFEKPYTIDPKCTMDGSDRGRIYIEIVDGRVAGTWKCDYTIDKRNTALNGAFEGNIDVEKTYSDENGEDPSKLFFIAKGTYMGTIYSAKTSRGIATGGQVYVTGWINPDGRAKGELTITQNKEWSGTYSWQW